MSGDTHYESVKLLLHCDGTDGSTTFTDSCLTPHTVTASGNAHIEVDQYKFGTASIQFDGTGDYLTSAASSDWDMGSGDFTVECWYKMATTPDANGYALISSSISTSNRPWGINITGSNGVNVWGRTSTTYYSASSSDGAGIDTDWHHLAGVRDGSTLRVFLDGVQKATGSVSGTLQSGQHLIIGRYEWNTASDFEGYIDDIRVTKGVARYTADFTAPTAAFPNIAGQIAGTVLDDAGDPVARVIRAYRRDTGVLVGSTTSSAGDGSYSIDSTTAAECSVLCLDDAGGDDFNDLVLRVTPA